MNFELPESAEQFRTELRQFLDEELPDWWTHLFSVDERTPGFMVELCRKLAEKNWLTMAWPKEFGGQEADVWMRMVLNEEMRYVGEPRGSHYMCVNYIGPLIMQVGTPQQQERFLKPMSSGDALWCQGFSEPGAGSDLSALQTKAIDNGKCFVVNGQKIWTSYATHAQWCLLIARSDPDSTRYSGLSVFAVDMKSPGLTVRPIDSLGGPSEINEVFFEDVEVPYDCVLGPVNEGWSTILNALANERLGIAFHSYIQEPFDKLLEYAKNTRDDDGRPLSEKPSVRAGLVRMYAHWKAARMLFYRVAADHEMGNMDSVGPAISKVFATEAAMEAAAVASNIIGPRAQLNEYDESAPLGGLAVNQWVYTLPTLIAAGTNEIQRNIIAQRGLGLPR